MNTKLPEDIDAYISGFPGPVQKKLEQLRATIHKAVPGLKEAIKYGMPAFVYKGNLVYFAAHKKHIGFYPVPRSGFEKELSAFEGSKGTVKFALDKPLPLVLIGKMVKYMAKEQDAKEEPWKKKK